MAVLLDDPGAEISVVPWYDMKAGLRHNRACTKRSNGSLVSGGMHPGRDKGPVIDPEDESKRQRVDEAFEFSWRRQGDLRLRDMVVDILTEA